MNKRRMRSFIAISRSVMLRFMLLLILAFTIASCSAQQRRTELPSADAQHSHTDTQQRKGENRMFPIQFTEEELRERLDDKQYRIMCEGGTEAPFSGKYNKFYEKGRYLCSACGHEPSSQSHPPARDASRTRSIRRTAPRPGPHWRQNACRAP